MILQIVVIVLTAYLLGNLNGAVLMSGLLSGDDVRKHGSGNAGLTNFVRTFGGGQAIFVVLIDVAKAVLACLVGRLILEPYGLALEGTMLGAVAVSLGHDFPALLGLHGGKGILCGVSVAAVLDWRCAVLIFGLFLAALLLTRYVSLGSILGGLGFAAFFALMYYDRPWIMVGGIFIGLLAVAMHHGNIRRLLNGTERKQSFGKKRDNS